MLTKILNIIIALLLLAVLFTAIHESDEVWAGKEEVTAISVEEIAGGVDIASGVDIRYGIFSDFIFAFELLSLLLLAALMGALYIAKKEAV
ncbi:MAG: hypothetical protein KJ714_01670 [Euryarchaeota archaeon]|nr:hypothetical protein [Euryarchaeota archaeon]